MSRQVIQVESVSVCRGPGTCGTRDALRIGLAIPLQGPGGIFGPSCEAVADLCRRQLNVSGVLGREVELEVIDAGQPAQEVADDVRDLLDCGRIDALTGWHISSVREQVAPVTTGRIPYVYTSLYEGGETREGVFCSGETPGQQVAPALRWLRDELGLRRWHLVGANYVWPERSATAALGYAWRLGLDVVSSHVVRFGAADFDGVLDDIERGPVADGVLLFLVGQDAVAFNREFAARGLDEHLVRFTGLMEENMLLASGGAATHDLYVAAGYFRSLPTAGSLDLVGEYARMFGPDAPPLNNQAESCYEGIRILAALFSAARDTELEQLLGASDGLGYDGPRGAVDLRAGHLRQTVYLAKADGTEFDVITSL